MAVVANLREEIRSVEDLVAAMKKCDADFPRGGLWWRGQPHLDLPLLPKVHRPPLGVGDEQTLANRFRLKAPARHPSCPQHEDHARWLFLMQHYGYATRLLDWTESPLIGAFFAVAFEPFEEGPAELFVLEPSALNEVQGGPHVVVNPAQDSFRLFEAAFDRNVKAPPLTLAVACDEVDVRMVVQQSVFTVHGSETPLDSHAQRDKFLRSFVIPSEARPLLAMQVVALGFDRQSLFPDLDNLSKGLLLQYGRVDRPLRRPTPPGTPPARPA